MAGDANGGYVTRAGASPGYCAFDDVTRSLPNLQGIVLDPTRLREDLFVFLLVDADDAPTMIEEHAAGASGALVYGGNIFGHLSPLLCI